MTRLTLAATYAAAIAFLAFVATQSAMLVVLTLLLFALAMAFAIITAARPYVQRFTRIFFQSD